jgi:hypothetical protein
MSNTERVLPTESFTVNYGSLEEGAPDTGKIARLSWDSEIFGFGVADYEPSAETSVEPEHLAGRLAAWERRNAVHIVSCRVSAGRAPLADRLPAAGFRFIELQLRATLPRLLGANLRDPRLTVRAPAPEDHSRLLEIAGTAFRFGRYHADPRFPRVLADQRYRIWVKGALAERSQQTRLFVAGPVGQPSGFLHAVVAERVADIRLAGVDPDNSGIAGPELFLGALKRFAAEGVERVTARLSAANTSALNLYASLSFRFHEPELVFHRGGPPFAVDRLASP